MSKNLETLFSPYTLGTIELKNRIVMAPMTRSRAIGNVPNELIVKHYADRSDAGLLITEGTSPSPNGLGYARIPGIFNDAQVKGWKEVTDAVHAKGGKIFMQLMHSGRIGHAINLPEGAEVIGASPIAPPTTQMWTDTHQMQAILPPRELTTEEIALTIEEFVNSSKNAIKAGFDGVEIHAANGYLPMQFLNPASNQRTDKYGGSPENRNRFVIELTNAIINAIGKDKTGIRLSPFGKFNDMLGDNTEEQQYIDLIKALKEAGVVYLHLIRYGIPPDTLETFTSTFDGTIILNGGYNADQAEKDLEVNKADLISFGSSFISNPDLVQRFKTGVELSTGNPETFYSPGVEGYNDYPFAK